MAVESRNTIKGWFETSDEPTQAQFWAWIDSFFHKNDVIPIDNVDGLSALTATVEALNEPKIEHFLDISATQITVTIATLPTNLDKIKVYENGIRYRRGGDYSISGQNINSLTGGFNGDVTVEF